MLGIRLINTSLAVGFLFSSFMYYVPFGTATDIGLAARDMLNVLVPASVCGLLLGFTPWGKTVRPNGMVHALFFLGNVILATRLIWHRYHPVMSGEMASVEAIMESMNQAIWFSYLDVLFIPAKAAILVGVVLALVQAAKAESRSGL